MMAKPGDLVRIGFRWGGDLQCPLALIIFEGQDATGRQNYTTLLEGKRGLHSFYDYQISGVVSHGKETKLPQ